MNLRLIAVDIGAGSGRVMFGRYSDGALTLREENRFTHPLERGPRGELNWNFPIIWNRVREAIERILAREGTVDSIGVESFSSDFCVFTEDGQLSAPMASYRHYLGPQWFQPLLSAMDREAFWRRTGNAPVSYFLLCQLMHQQDINPALRERGSVVLPLANAINYLLCGKACTDVTVSSMSLLNDAATGQWDEALCHRFLAEPAVLPPVVPCATVLGPCVLPCTGDAPQVVNVGMHDTAVANSMIGRCAMDQICINAGTWISVGVITDHPVTSDEALALSMTNAGLPDGRNLLCRIMMGTWYLQQLRRFWQSQGREIGYGEMGEMAGAAQEPWRPIDVWQGDYFDSDPDLPRLIREWILERYGVAVESDAALLRCVYEGIAEAIGKQIENLEALLDRRCETIYMGGGAVRDAFLIQCIERRCSKPVVCLPVESTAVGNALIQLQALGALPTEEMARALLGAVRFETGPQN